MKHTDDIQLRSLLERFMDGATSNAEEQLIYERFRSGDVPTDLEEYRPMVMWLQGGMRDEHQAKLRVRRFRRYAVPVAIAASVAIVLGIAINFIMRPSSNLTEEDYITYAGSYVIKNGVKNTDLDEILPELLEAELLVEQQQMTADKIISSMEDVIDTSDPAVRAALESAFSE